MLLMPYNCFRPKIFFTSREGVNLASYPFQSEQVQVIMGGIIPDRLNRRLKKSAMLTAAEGVNQEEL